MANDDEFAFGTGERDVDEFGGGTVRFTPAEHGFRQIPCDGGIKDHDVTLLPLYAVNRADVHAIAEVGLTDEILKLSDLVAVRGNDADRRLCTGWKTKGLLRQGYGHGGMVVVGRRSFMVLIDPGLRITGIDED